jgi:hypothetical protein
MNLVNERAEVMNVITHADESTACAMCGFSTLLIEACVEHNEEECPNCGQHYRVYEE